MISLFAENFSYKVSKIYIYSFIKLKIFRSFRKLSLVLLTLSSISKFVQNICFFFKLLKLIYIISMNIEFLSS